jgi:hypothetical protein
MECRHLDGDTANNRLNNLRWGTRQEQFGDMGLHGTKLHGSKNPMAKLREQDIPEIRSLCAAGHRYFDIGFLFGISPSIIGQIARGELWKHV